MSPQSLRVNLSRVKIWGLVRRPTWRFMGSYKGSFKGPFKGIYRDSIRV